MFAPAPTKSDSVAAKMNIFQIIGLFIGAALPPMLANLMGWSNMAMLFAGVSVIAIYAGYPAMFNAKELHTDTSFPRFWMRSNFEFADRSYLTAAGAQTMRFLQQVPCKPAFFFFIIYSLKVDEGLATVILGMAFLIAMLSLYPWRNWVANKLNSRRTLMIANAIMILGIVPMGFSSNIYFTYATTVIVDRPRRACVDR